MAEACTGRPVDSDRGRKQNALPGYRAGDHRCGQDPLYTPGTRQEIRAIRSSDPELGSDTMEKPTLELVEAKQFAGSGMDLPEILMEPRGLVSAEGSA